MPLTAQQREKILDSPAARPPPGVTPNFEHPINHKEIAYGMLAFYLILVNISVGIRLYTKWKIMRKVVMEDSKSLMIEGTMDNMLIDFKVMLFLSWVSQSNGI